MAGTELEALRAFRAGLYVCLGRRRDALFEVLDALLTPGPCPSLPHLSLTPGHRRGWGSVYAALRRGHVHVEALRALLLRQPLPEGPPLYAVDVSVWPRADAATSPGRGSQYHSPRRRRAGGDPVVPGWASQWLVRLSPARDSWTAPVGVRRVGPQEKPTAVAAEQLKALVAAPPAGDVARVPLVLFDAGYDACGFTDALADTPVALRIRLRRNRHFWFAPDPATQPRSGRPKRHGARFVCNDPTTWPAPSAELRVADEIYGPVDVRAWAGLHTSVRRPVRPGVVGQPRGPRRLTHGTVLRLAVGRLPGRRRTPAVVWLWWQSAPEPGGAPRAPAPEELDRLWRGYCRRRRSGTDLQISEADAPLGHAAGAPARAGRCPSPGRAPAGPGWCSRRTPSCASPAGPWPTTACRGSAPSPRPSSRRRGSTGVSRRWRGACPPSPRRQNPAGAPRAGPKGAAPPRRRATRPSRRPPDPGGLAHPCSAAAFPTTCGVAAQAGAVKRPGPWCFNPVRVWPRLAGRSSQGRTPCHGPRLGAPAGFRDGRVAAQRRAPVAKLHQLHAAPIRGSPAVVLVGPPPRRRAWEPELLRHDPAVCPPVGARRTRRRSGRG